MASPPKAPICREFKAFVVGIFIVSISYVISMSCSFDLQHNSMRTRELTTASICLALGILIWPFVWGCLVGDHVASNVPLTAIGFAWPWVTLLIDILNVTNQPSESQEHERGISAFSYEGNSISSLALALGGLLMSQAGKKMSQSAAPMLSACILMVVAFVVPSPSVHMHSRLGAMLLATKKVAMAFCIGLILSAVCISLDQGLRGRSIGALSPEA
jgi:hypothetical protein